MYRYALLNLLFVVPVALLAWRTLRTYRRQALILAFILLGLTVVFDSLIIWADIVLYNPDHISGIKIALAPIEDFAYALVAALMVPALWERWSD